MNIQIQTYNRELGFELMGTPDSFTAGTTNNLPGKAILKAKCIHTNKMFGTPIILDFNLILNPNSDVAIVSEWFYLQLKNRCEKIVVNGDEIHIAKDSIQHALNRFK